MRQLTDAVHGFVTDDSGATMVEYGLLVALIAVVVAATVVTLGTNIKARFLSASNCAGTPASC